MENENEKNVLPQGWKDVTLTADMPASALINFFNILNQRLCVVEDVTTLKLDDGRILTVTQYYAEQEKLAQEAQAQEREQETEQVPEISEETNA